MTKAVSVSVKDATWSLPLNRKKILHPISFDLGPGKILGVVGPNGSGKSTLLRLLYRFYKPTSGLIKIDDTNIWLVSNKEVARKVAVVLQEQPSDFALNVFDIVSLGRTPHRSWGSSTNGIHDNKVVKNALEYLSLLEFADRKFNTLSGGERQRVMVARAIAQEPSLLVLDEPTNHLDIKQQLEVLNLIRDLPITIITSVHDLNMASSVCDEVLLLNHGYSLGYGIPKDIFSEKTISDAFDVKTRKEVLLPSNLEHLTFHL